MSDIPRADSADRIDRFVRGELTSAEARALAQESLGSAELFDELTYASVAKAAACTRPLPNARLMKFPRKRNLLYGGAIAAAGLIALASVYFLHTSGIPRAPSTLKPALAGSATAGQPIVLAAGFPTKPDATAVFRGVDASRRTPRATGSVVSLEDGQATVDLGPLDGVTKGTELEIFRVSKPATNSGRLAVVTVFRERARARISGAAAVHIHDEVRVPAETHARALLDESRALSAQGDLHAALQLATTAAAWARDHRLQPGLSRQILEKLAELEFQTGALDSAEKHYAAALDGVSGDAGAWNNLAVLRMLRGDYAAAEAPLQRAARDSAKTGLEVTLAKNNRAVLAELRGDKNQAATLYADALAAINSLPNAPEDERRAVESNLSRIQKSR